jgi:polysaccharide deacetylase 2 family uncharacterized protein YibQ
MHCLNVLGIVTKKQALSQNVIRASIIDLPPKLLVGYSSFVFSLRSLMREFASAGGELVIHAALHPKNSPTPQIPKFLK